MTEIAQAQPMDNFIDGQRDCKEGKQPSSGSEDYLRGYGAQYQLEENNSWNKEASYAS